MGDSMMKVSHSMRKRTYMMILCMLMVCFFSGCSTSVPIYEPGTYTNSSQGYYSTLNIQVTVDEYRILEIEIISHEEPEILSDIVFKELIPAMKKQNSAQVDEVSGATYTSRALIKAVSAALDEAFISDEEGAVNQ